MRDFVDDFFLISLFGGANVLTAGALFALERGVAQNQVMIPDRVEDRVDPRNNGWRFVGLIPVTDTQAIEANLRTWLNQM